jgi:hypothetical protein
MQSFQGTICEIKEFEHLKLNGQVLPQVEEAPYGTGWNRPRVKHIGR